MPYQDCLDLNMWYFRLIMKRHLALWNVWAKYILGRGNCKSKGPEAEKGLDVFELEKEG